MKENTWQPIETAPKDGSFVLVCNKSRYFPETSYFGYYHPNAKGKKAWRNFNGNTLYPTHWMPMIAPPNK